MSSVMTALHVPISDVHAWCDSTIVLSWLDGNPKRFKTYVGNRLSTILSYLPPSTWHHVPTQDNPADCASRGLSPSELVTHSLWWDGPPWLREEPVAMPHQPLPLPGDVKVSCNAIVSFPPTWIENNFSSYHKLLLVTSWCLRFVTNGKAAINNQSKLLSSTITTVEIQSTEQQLFRLAQQQTIPAELIRLNQHQLVGSSSPIKALSPFLDKHGLIRVGGRLANAHLTNSQMHPVILSAKSWVTCLLNICLWAIVAPLSFCQLQVQNSLY